MARQSGDAELVARAFRWGFLGFCLFLAICVMLQFVVLPLEIFQTGPFRTTVKDPAAEFTEYTRLRWPESAVVVTVGDDHRGWHGDGEFRLVFDADKETLSQLLAQKPPWGDAEWKSGPVPDEIAGHCFLGLSNGADYRQGLADRHVRYCAHDFKLSTIPWHNGKLLAIDPNAGRVFLSWWDF